MQTLDRRTREALPVEAPSCRVFLFLRIAAGGRLRRTSRLMCFSSALNPDLLPVRSPLLEPIEHCDRCNNRRRLDASS